MRKVIVSEFVSLDGVVEDPGWTLQFTGEEQQRFKFDELAESDALLLGRVTYEGFAAAWPNMMEQYEGPRRAALGEYAEMMNGYPKHVVSTTLEEPLEWNNSTPYQRERRGGSVQPQAAARSGHLDLRQRRPREHAHATRPHRRVWAHGLSCRCRGREAPLQRRERHDRPETRGNEDVRCGRRCPYLPASNKGSGRINPNGGPGDHD